MHPPERRLRLLALLLLLPALQGCAALAALYSVNAVHDRRTFGTVVDDDAMAVRVTDAIHRGEDGPGDGNHVRAVSYNRTVLLVGEVESEAVSELAEERAKRVPKVVRVVNELEVTEPRSLGRRSRDSLLTARVKTALIGVDVPGFTPQRVKVVSVDGSVYLMGLLTEAEADRIAERVARVRGVKEVIRIIEFIPETG
ncbi:MAG: BON domain-containing protein [Pseudomonadota bacterium]